MGGQESGSQEAFPWLWIQRTLQVHRWQVVFVPRGGGGAAAETEERPPRERGSGFAARAEERPGPLDETVVIFSSAP